MSFDSAALLRSAALVIRKGEAMPKNTRQDFAEKLMTAASLIEEMQRELELTRSILAAGDISSLPTFYPTHQMAADRMRELGEAEDDHSRLRWPDTTGQ